MDLTHYHDCIHVHASPAELEPYEQSVAGNEAVAFTFRLRYVDGLPTVAEPIRSPAGIPAFPRLILSEALAAYGQGYLDGAAWPDKPLHQFSSVHMARGPYYDNGVGVGQQTARLNRRRIPSEAHPWTSERSSRSQSPESGFASATTTPKCAAPWSTLFDRATTWNSDASCAARSSGNYGR